MQIPALKLADHLKAQRQKGWSGLLYAVVGDEPLLVQESTDQIRVVARELGFSERSSFTASGAHFDWSMVLGRGQEIGLFDERPMLDIRIPTGKLNKEATQLLPKWWEQIAQQKLESSCFVLMTFPRLDKATQNTAWYKVLDKHATIIKADTIDRSNLPQWIAMRLTQAGFHVENNEAGRHALQFFADKVEGNLLAAHQEIEKLSLLHPKGPITYQDLEKTLWHVARYNPFKLSEALWSGQVLRLARMIHGLHEEGETPVLVHFALAEEVRLLWRLKQATLAGRPIAMALQEQRVWGIKEQHLTRVVPRVSLEQSQRWLHEAHLVDGIIKGIEIPHWPKQPWLALQQLALSIAKHG